MSSAGRFTTILGGILVLAVPALVPQGAFAGNTSATLAPVAFTSTPPFPALVGGTYAMTASGGTVDAPVTFAVRTGSAAVCHLSGPTTVTLDAKGYCSVLARRRATGGDPLSVAQQSFRVAARNPIKHVVLIYQENHSFDETLGAYCATRANPCNGYVGPVELADGTVVPMTHSPDIVPVVEHSVAGQRAAINGGAMDGWAALRGCEPPGYACLTYYEPADMPNLVVLADRFTVSDQTFSLADSSSWGGHLYAATADLDGFTGDLPDPTPGVPLGPGWGCDSNRVADWIDPQGMLQQVPSCVPAADGSGPFRDSPVPHLETIFDELETAGLSWRIYGAPTQRSEQPHGGGGYGWSICPTFADCIYTGQRAKLVDSADILTAAQSGHLPAYSVLTPSATSANVVGTDTSQHNHASMIAGDDWIGRVLTAIQNGPNWKSTAVFITYDDCGCFYDHVPPPLNPDGSLAGIRLPMVIVSPWAVSGYTDSRPTTLAGVLAFTERIFSLPPMTTNDAGAYPYSDSFNFNQAPLSGATMMRPHIPPASITYAKAHPTEDDPS